MGNARRELEVRLDEIIAASHFMDRAYRLRPRIGQAINWNAPAHELELLRMFMVDDTSRAAEILGALHVRSIAAFERFIRKLCSEIVDAKAQAASDSGNLPTDFKFRHMILSARLLSSLDHPKDYISFNPQIVVERMARCERDSLPYELNAVSFSSSMQSPTVESIEKLLATVGLPAVFETLGRSTSLQTILSTRGTRATSSRVQERLAEVVRWRNNLAHGGDDERTITVEELDAVVALLRTLGMEIDLAAQEI